MAGNGKSPPASPNPDAEGDLQSVNNVILATIAMWVDKLPAREVEALALKHFSFDKLKEAVTDVRQFIGCTMAQSADLLARNLVGAVVKLGQSDELNVKFTVESKDLFAVPGVESTLMPLDAASVGARLLGMEASLEALTASLQQMSNVGKAVETLTSVVTKLQEQQRQVVLPAGPGLLPASGSAGFQQQSASSELQGKQLYSQAAAKGVQEKRKRGESSPSSPRQEAPLRPQPGTPPSALFQAALVQNGVSQKLRQLRQMSESEAENAGFQPVLGKLHKKLLRNKKLLQGSSEVTAGGSIPVPFSVFIRNTDPSYSEGDVQKYLEECANALPAEEKLPKKLEILQVRNIPIKRTDGAPLRSKCWKVSVPPEFREHMLNPKAYPSSWFARQWFRNGNQLPGTEASLQQEGIAADTEQQNENILLRNSSTGTDLMQIGNSGSEHSSTDVGA